MNGVGEPCAGEPHARFDRGRLDEKATTGSQDERASFGPALCFPSQDAFDIQPPTSPLRTPLPGGEDPSARSRRKSPLGTNSVQFGDIFNALTIDGGGNLYAVAAGFVGTAPYARTSSVYLLSSSNAGQSWTGPVKLTDATEADMLPAAAGGGAAGELAVGYFRTVNGVTDPNNSTAKWTYQAAISRDATSATPTFVRAPVATNSDGSAFIFHAGDICNQGILCGVAPGSSGDRSLLDFTSVTPLASGCPAYTFAGNPSGKNDAADTSNYVAVQTADCLLPSPPGPNGRRRRIPAGPEAVEETSQAIAPGMTSKRFWGTWPGCRLSPRRDPSVRVSPRPGRPR